MYIGAIMQRYILTVDVPVPLEGGRHYVLTQAFFPDYFERAFGADKLPREWIVAIADKQGRTIARRASGKRVRWRRWPLRCAKLQKDERKAS